MSPIEAKQLFHVISIPLIILATLAVGFILVYLKDIMVPFVVGVFFVYLLKPVIDYLTKPFSCSCLADMCEHRLNVRRVHHQRWYRRAKKDPEEEEIDRLLVSMNIPSTGHDSVVSRTVTHPCRNECRCPYWLAVVVSLCFASTLLSGLVLLPTRRHHRQHTCVNTPHGIQRKLAVIRVP